MKRNRTKQRQPECGRAKSVEWIYGRHAVHAALSAGRRVVHEVVVATQDKQWSERAVSSLSDQDFQYNDSCDPKTLTRLVGDAQHQGVAAKVSSYPYAQYEQWLAGIDGPRFLVVLDRIQDPHNFGAIVRTALGCGAHGVVVAKHEAAPVTPAVVKASAGATEWLSIVQVNNIVSCINDLKNKQVWTVGLAGEAQQSVYDYDFAGDHAVVMGAEGKGLHKLVRESCDILLHLPIAGAVGSYNVSVAAAMTMGELQRQRKSSK